MTKLIILSGIPASGKSTWAMELLKKEPGKWKRFNRDLLRLMMDNGEWSQANERIVIKVRDYGIRTALRSGFNVIVDDTNLPARTYKDLCKIAQIVGDVEVVHKYFHITLKEALERDANRERSVGESVIKQFYGKYIKGGRFKIQEPAYFLPLDQSIPVIEYDPKLPDAIVCDIDGTLAHIVDRSPFDGESCASDVVDKAVLAVLNRFNMYKSMRHGGTTQIILMSGRNGESRPQTEDWLEKNDVPYTELNMRAPGDFRKDSIVKGELFDEHVRGKYNVLFVLDDRNQVVTYWRSIGLKVFQVAEGDF